MHEAYHCRAQGPLIGQVGMELFYRCMSVLSPPEVPRCGNIILNIYLQDGLFAAPLFQAFHARHDLYYARDDPLDPERFTAGMTDIVCIIVCISHISGRAVKWGLLEHTSEQILDDAHGGMEALRNGSTHSLKKVDTFLATHVAFRASDDQAHRYCFHSSNKPLLQSAHMLSASRVSMIA